ncbi:RING-H2 finger protein ATL3-like [Cynara cardunculus var. scolymus]|nr:RING-H2 finger protein ATL3-like [Cynara cardunculus var. scolymus]
MPAQKLDDPSVMELTGKVLIATIVALFLLLLLVFCFHLYAKWLWHRRQQSMDGLNNRRHQDQHHSGVTVLRRGLDASFLKTIPIVHLDSKDGLECAVCLSELQEGEKTRILPKCNHAFHVECIDMWFHSHSTCPICRNLVSEQTDKISVESLLEEQSSRGDFPTNMLFWGDETQVSTLTSQLEETQHQALPNEATSSSSQTNNDRAKPDLVIDIPSSQVTSEDEKTPVLSRMQSLRRILSSSSRRFNPFSPSIVNNN